MAQENSIEFFSGNDITLRVTVVDEQTQEPLNLAGTQGLVWALAKAQGKTPIIEKTLGSGVTIVNASAGLVDIELAHADTEPLKDVYYHEMRMITSGGKRVTLMYGEVTVILNTIKD